MRPAIHLCAIGDSLVAGAGDPAGLGWIGRLVVAARGQGHDVTLYNLGIGCDTSADVAVRWRTESARRLSAEHPARLVFGFGANDCALVNGERRLPVRTTLRNAALILQHAAVRAPTLMVGPAPLADAGANTRIRELDVELDRLCRRLALSYASVFEALAQDRHWMRQVGESGGRHPAAGGYRHLAKLVAAHPAWAALLQG